jgi:hypothetical protein
MFLVSLSDKQLTVFAWISRPREGVDTAEPVHNKISLYEGNKAPNVISRRFLINPSYQGRRIRITKPFDIG